MQLYERHLMNAAASDNVTYLRIALFKGANVNVYDEYRNTPLHIASRYSDMQIIEELIVR